MKPVIAILRSKGYLLVIYIVDILLQAATPLELSQTIHHHRAVFPLREIGSYHRRLMVPFRCSDHWSLQFTTKSVTTPTQVVNILGFVLDSQNMTISMGMQT